MFFMSGILNITLGRSVHFHTKPSCHFHSTHSVSRGNAAGGIYRAFQLNGHKSPVSFKLNNHRP